MSDNQPKDDSLRQEFETLGRNLTDALRAAWEAPESKKLRDDLVGGLSDLGTTLRNEAETIQNSQAAQQVRSSVDQVGERLRAPEVQDKVRSELLGALQTVNNELQKVIDHWNSPQTANAANAANAGAADAADSVPAPDLGNDAPPPAPDEVVMGGNIASEPEADYNAEDPFARTIHPDEPGKTEA